jgi:hypothetical protein
VAASADSTLNLVEGCVAGNGRHGPAHRQIAPLNELSHASLHGSAVQHDVPVAFPAPQPQVGPQTIDQPFAPAAGMYAPKCQDVAQAELNDGRLRLGHYRGPG